MRGVVLSFVLWAGCALAVGCGGRATGGTGAYALEDAGRDATRDAASDGPFVPSDAGNEPCNAVLGDLEGRFLLSMSTTLNVALPIVFDTRVVVEGAQARLDIQPLVATDRKTPVGPVQSSAPFGLAGGSFRVVLDNVVVPLEANPLSAREIEMDVRLLGALCDGFYWCGELYGNVTRPVAIDLAGSAWTLEPVTSTGDFPEPPRTSCQGLLAVPVEDVNPE